MDVMLLFLVSSRSKLVTHTHTLGEGCAGARSDELVFVAVALVKERERPVLIHAG